MIALLAALIESLERKIKCIIVCHSDLNIGIDGDNCNIRTFIFVG